MTQFHKPVNRTNLKLSCSLHAAPAFWVALWLICTITPVTGFADNDSYRPYVESLQIVQQRAYAQAAARGFD